MIVIGYQGIGKTTLSLNDSKYIDLESTNTWFMKDGKRKRWDNWAEIYTNFAADLSIKYDRTVFVSSHDVVRRELMRFVGLTTIIVCCPIPELKDQWVQRLQERYDRSGLDKDYRALMNAKDRYTENVNELMASGYEVARITSMDYKLGDVLAVYDSPAKVCPDWEGLI